jgi:hypothetical protein
MLGAARRSRNVVGKSALGALLTEAALAWERFARPLSKPHLLRPDGHFITWSNEKSAITGRECRLSADVFTASLSDADADVEQPLNAPGIGTISGLELSFVQSLDFALERFGLTGIGEYQPA